MRMRLVHSISALTFFASLSAAIAYAGQVPAPAQATPAAVPATPAQVLSPAQPVAATAPNALAPAAATTALPPQKTPQAPQPVPFAQTTSRGPQLPPPADDLKPGEIKISGLGNNSPQWTIMVLLTVLTIIPSLLICMTPFSRLLIVFHFLRQALGLQTTPSNQTLIGLSVIMTFFIMQPVAANIYRDAVIPFQEGKITSMDAVARAGGPMRQFMSHYVREKDLAMFIDLAKEPRPNNINDVSFRVLLPAYIISELKAGFQIGAVLFLPFLVVDMVVASITTSVGMMQLPPVVISTPLKILLFLMVDGWHLLIGSLIRSFN